MESFVMKAVLTGIFFGIWPIIMNKSGLGGNFSSFIFTGVMLIFMIIPAVISFNKTPTTGVSWAFVVTAGILGAIGMLIFNNMLGSAPIKKIGLLIVIVTITQTVAPAIFQV